MIRQLLARYTGRSASNDLAGDYTSTRRHVLIGGCGRSGTTLVRVVLDSHPSICCGPESEVFLATPLDVEKLQHKFQLNSDELNAAYRGSQSRAEFIDRFADLCCIATGKSRWAEKTPRNVLHLDYFFERFPESCFLHVLRDGRDVACSLRTHPRHRVENGKLVPVKTWKPMQECAERWRDSILAARPHFSNPKLRTVRYEELVDDPKTAIQPLLAYLNEPWDDAVLAHSDAKSRFRDVTTFPQNPEALAPIGGDALGRWERDMSDDDKRIFKAIAGDLLIECGYAANGNW